MNRLLKNLIYHCQRWFLSCVCADWCLPIHNHINITYVPSLQSRVKWHIPCLVVDWLLAAGFTRQDWFCFKSPSHPVVRTASLKLIAHPPILEFMGGSNLSYWTFWCLCTLTISPRMIFHAEDKPAASNLKFNKLCKLIVPWWQENNSWRMNWVLGEYNNNC